MSLARASLWLSAAAFGGFGLWLTLDPAALGAVEVGVDTAAARTEIRAFYGGLELGLAAFFVLAARRPAWHRPALTVQVLGLGGAGVMRGLSALLDGGATPFMGALVGAEVLAGCLGAVALRALDQAERAPA